MLATLNEDLEFAPGDAEHLGQARQIEPRIGRAYGLGRRILCRDRVNGAGLHGLVVFRTRRLCLRLKDEVAALMDAGKTVFAGGLPVMTGKSRSMRMRKPSCLIS